jgi:oligopeptidase B
VDHEYSVVHAGRDFYVLTNWKAKNFRLMKTRVSSPSKRSWREVVPHRSDVLLQSTEAFKDFLTVVARKEGLVQIEVLPYSGKGAHAINFGEPAYLAYVGDNYEFETDMLRYRYTSMTTPYSVYDYDVRTRAKTLQKEDEVLGGFDKDAYVTERVYATARDGKRVPISLVSKKDLPRDGTSPLFLYGYGSYGASRDASFNPYRISLLNRGFVYAIAHVRGGAELGREWYEDGKLLNKKNTFTDFIDCARFLVDEKYADPERLFAQGGSAGGLLIGAVINMEPDLFTGVIASVPWVDVVTTMLDASIPLTTSEYDEWGNPNSKEYYEYMLSYSPYDQVEAKAYPNILVTTSFHDSQVQYWEPAKWVAKLRALKTDANLLLMKTRMQAGHGGASGRYDRYRDVAFEYSFFLDLAGIHE